MKKLILPFLILLIGCYHHNDIPVGKLSQSAVTTNFLHFYTTFTIDLLQGRTMIVVSRSDPSEGIGDDKVTFIDTLRQPDGKEINFDCDNIDDKIIDPNLVNEISPICTEIRSRATEFWKSHDYEPDEFVDEQGYHWTKSKK